MEIDPSVIVLDADDRFDGRDFPSAVRTEKTEYFASSLTTREASLTAKFLLRGVPFEKMSSVRGGCLH
jgi:hypothetical protein